MAHPRAGLGPRAGHGHLVIAEHRAVEHQHIRLRHARLQVVRDRSAAGYVEHHPARRRNPQAHRLPARPVPGPHGILQKQRDLSRHGKGRHLNSRQGRKRHIKRHLAPHGRRHHPEHRTACQHPLRIGTGPEVEGRALAQRQKARDVVDIGVRHDDRPYRRPAQARRRKDWMVKLRANVGRGVQHHPGHTIQRNRHGRLCRPWQQALAGIVTVAAAAIPLRQATARRSAQNPQPHA